MGDLLQRLPKELTEELLAYRCDYHIAVDYDAGGAFEVNLLYPTLVVSFEIKLPYISRYVTKLAGISRLRSWVVETGNTSHISRNGNDLVINRDGYITAIVLYCPVIVKMLKVIASHPLDKDLHIRI